MSWLFSRALVEAFSAANSWDGEPSVQLNVMPTEHAFWRNDKPMDASRLSRFGLTCAVLPANRGGELLTWFRAGFPVRTFPSQGGAQDSQESEVDSGFKCSASFVKFDRATSTWKTRQCSLLGGLESYSETWPRWGLMLDGECLALTISEATTNGNASGLLPTPVATDGKGAPNNPQVLADRLNNPRGVRLEEFFKRKLLPTPTVCGNDIFKGASPTSGDGLTTALKRRLLPTPTAGDSHSAGRLDEWGGVNPFRGTELGELHLSPLFVEAMMMWPIGWTDFAPLETDKFQQWLRQHGESSMRDSGPAL